MSKFLGSALPLIISVLAFGLMIFVHELGHFVAAKLSGVKVNEFAIGMGPTLVKFRRGETKYALRLLPVGGFVSMEGEDENSHDPRSFSEKPVWKRAIILVAGATMNIILGFVLSSIITISQEGPIASTTIAKFDEGSVSDSVLQVDDKILKINGSKVNIDMDILFSMARVSDGFATFQVERGGQKMTLEKVPFKVATDEESGQKSLEVDFKVLAKEKNFGTILHQSIFYVGSIAKTVWISLIEMISGKYGLNDLTGPIGAATTLSTALSIDWRYFLAMICMFTVNIGIFNLLPFPALDGGRVVFLLIELIRGKPVDPKYEAYVNAAGLGLLFLLMIIVAVGDIGRLIK